MESRCKSLHEQVAAVGLQTRSLWEWFTSPASRQNPGGQPLTFRKALPT
jgi:hypothetical protein